MSGTKSYDFVPLFFCALRKGAAAFTAGSAGLAAEMFIEKRAGTFVPALFSLSCASHAAVFICRYFYHDALKLVCRPETYSAYALISIDVTVSAAAFSFASADDLALL